MTKSEWSGWFQAIFSVAAILAAIWIARSGERARRVEAANLAEASAVLMHAELHKLSSAIQEAEEAYRDASGPVGNWRPFIEAANSIARLSDPTAEHIMRIAVIHPQTASDLALLPVLLYRLRSATQSLDWIQNAFEPRMKNLRGGVLANLEDVRTAAARCSVSLSAFYLGRGAVRESAQLEEQRWGEANRWEKVRIKLGLHARN
jgi:hypothetical protein